MQWNEINLFLLDASVVKWRVVVNLFVSFTSTSVAPLAWSGVVVVLFQMHASHSFETNFVGVVNLLVVFRVAAAC